MISMQRSGHRCSKLKEWKNKYKNFRLKKINLVFDSQLPNEVVKSYQMLIKINCHSVGKIILITRRLSREFKFFSKGIRPVVPSLFGTRDQFHGRQFFHRLGLGGGWFLDDSSALHLLCTLFLLLLHCNI